MNPQPQPDAIYQSFNKNLYKITGDEEEDSIMDMLSADPTANNSNNVQTSASDIGSGVNTATSPQATGSQQAGKQTFDDTTDGYFLGIVNGLGVFSLGGSSSYIKWNGTTLTVVGGVSISQLDIPDTTTANSFHTDSNGNSWWGANVASGLSAANASINSAGTAVFKSVSIGGTVAQYVITNSGIFSYGDASDGTATISVNTSLSSDKYYDSLTINLGITLNPNGYRIFVKNTLTVNGSISGNGTIGNNGQDGINIGNPTPVAGGSVSLADGYLKGSVATGNGGSPSGVGQAPGVAGAVGIATANSLGSAGATGGSGGAANSNAGGVGGTGGAITPPNVKLIANWHLATLLDITPTGSTIKYNNSGAAGGGGSGASDTNIFGAAGGGGAANGRIVAIYARNIVIGASGSISSNGGVGGNGGAAYQSSGNNGGAGGGGGGNGGIILLTYNQLTNAGSITATGGIGGTGGIKSGTGIAGSNGITGSAGTIYQFQLSL